MYSQPQGGKAGIMNQVFEADVETMAKIRKKFTTKKALHWFMVNKAVSSQLRPCLFN